MRTTVVHCDRCRGEITEGMTVLTIEAGSLRNRLHNPVDLCSVCAAELIEWITPPRPPAKGEA
jgi:hypothetical protein